MQEQIRLAEARDKTTEWKQFGPYLTERQWGTVREDYSADGNAWDYISHDMARAYAYRWGEEGLGGISDDQQRLCFGIGLWNGADNQLKERLFGLTTLNGLDVGLKAEHDRAMPLAQVSDRLFVLPAGRPDPDPLSGLTSDRMKRLVHQARSAFDWVVIDTPPVTLLPDANLLAACVDGVLLVVRAGKAPFQLVKRTVDTLGHDRILGVVMNAVDYAHDRNAGGYYEYYGSGYYGVKKGK